MDFAEEGGAAVREPVDQVCLPERMPRVEASREQGVDELMELGLASGRDTAR